MIADGYGPGGVEGGEQGQVAKVGIAGSCQGRPGGGICQPVGKAIVVGEIGQALGRLLPFIQIIRWHIIGWEMAVVAAGVVNVQMEARPSVGP